MECKFHPGQSSCLQPDYKGCGDVAARDTDNRRDYLCITHENQHKTVKGYTGDFYEGYAAYLLEPEVRRQHDYMLSEFVQQMHPFKPRVIDLGCGTGEYFKHAYWEAHFGADLNGRGPWCSFTGDYKTLDFCPEFVPNAFVSLFSTECCLNAKDKYDLYRRIFSKFPSIDYGLVSGVFYRGKENQETIDAAPGITSFQTVERASDHVMPLVTEWRCNLNVSSKFFGDEVEVWKIFKRRTGW